MNFAVNVVVSVDQVANALAIETPLLMQLAYEKGRWQARCESPSVATSDFGSMEEALIAGGEQAALEVQAAVIDRPRIIGKITPDSIPAEMF